MLLNQFLLLGAVLFCIGVYGVLARRNADVDDLNRRARRLVADAGELSGDPIEIVGRPFQIGDQIVCLRNDYRSDVRNGTTATITNINHQQRSVTIDTDHGVRQLDSAYLAAGLIRHGYAVTVHKAQGRTADHGLLLGTDDVTRESSYVGLSRGRESNRLYVVSTDCDDDLEHHARADDRDDPRRIVLDALRHPFDKWMSPVTGQILETTLKDDVTRLTAAEPLLLSSNTRAADYLAGKLKLGDAPPAADQREYGPTRPLSATEQKVYALGKEVFHRDAHCATCHQSSGTGTPGIYPPLNVAGNPWLADSDRLIKVVLKGLWGPLEINGQRLNPNNGGPPMLGFAGLLNDDEVAAVLSYVRQSFGNNLPLITPAQVAKVREQTKDRADFYMVEEIM
jgi:mono/diheme cytochrome c family protein